MRPYSQAHLLLLALLPLPPDVDSEDRISQLSVPGATSTCHHGLHFSGSVGYDKLFFLKGFSSGDFISNRTPSSPQCRGTQDRDHVDSDSKTIGGHWSRGEALL